MISISGSRFFCQFFLGYLQIGCEVHTVDYWIKNYKEIGEVHDFTESEIEEYKRYIDIIRLFEQKDK